MERQADASDRRARVVHPTPRQGRTLIAAAFRDHAAALERAVEGLSQVERAELVRLGLARRAGARAAVARCGERPGATIPEAAEEAVTVGRDREALD